MDESPSTDAHDDRRLQERRHVPRGGRRLSDIDGWRTLRMSVGAQVYAAVQATDSKPSIARSAALAGLSECGLAGVLNDLEDVKLGTIFRFAESHGLVVHVILSPGPRVRQTRL